MDSVSSEHNYCLILKRRTTERTCPERQAAFVSLVGDRRLEIIEVWTFTCHLLSFQFLKRTWKCESPQISGRFKMLMSLNNTKETISVSDQISCHIIHCFLLSVIFIRVLNVTGFDFSFSIKGTTLFIRFTRSHSHTFIRTCTQARVHNTPTHISTLHIQQSHLATALRLKKEEESK